MFIIWISLTLFFGCRYGIFGCKTIKVGNNIRTFVVKDPFCDYLFTPNEKQYYRWSVFPIKIESDITDNK